MEEKQRPLINDKIKQLTNTYNNMYQSDSSQFSPVSAQKKKTQSLCLFQVEFLPKCTQVPHCLFVSLFHTQVILVLFCVQEQFIDMWNQAKTQILEDSVLCEKIRQELQKFKLPLSLLEKDSEDDWKPINKIGLLIVPDHPPFLMGTNTLGMECLVCFTLSHESKANVIVNATLEKLYDTIVLSFPSSPTDYWITH